MLHSRFIRRELTRSGRQAGVLVLCVALSVVTLVAVDGLGRNIHRALLRDARSLHAADVILKSNYPFSPGLLTAVERLEAAGKTRAARYWRFYSMVRPAGADDSLLSELKVVEPGYPFYGKVELASGGEFAETLRPGTAIVEQRLLDRLALSTGDPIRVGEAELTVADVVTREPDRPVSFLSFGPRVFVSHVDRDAISLIETGSRVRHRLLLKALPGTTADGLAETLAARAIPGQERVETYRNAGSRVGRFFDNFLFFLALIGAFTLLLAGFGIHSALTALLREKAETVAVIRTLGASGGFITGNLVAVVALLGLAGTALGLWLGLGLQFLLPILFGPLLPPEMTLTVSPLSVVEGMLLGILAAGLFAFLPLYRLREIKPADVFRKETPAHARGIPFYLAAAAVTLLFAGAVVWQLRDVTIGLWFVLGTVGLVLITAGLAALALAGLRKLRPRNLRVRQAIRGLFRPGNATLAVTVTLAAGMAVLFALYLTEQNLNAAFTRSYPEDAPNLFFIDLQSDQLDPFAELLGRRPRFYPAIRAHLKAINDVPIDPEVERQRRGDDLARPFNLTYRDEPLPDEEIIRGETMYRPDAEGLQVSILQDVVDIRPLEIGDRLTFRIQGVPVTAAISSIRKRQRDTIRPYFYFVFPSDSLLADAPQTAFTAIRVPPERIGTLQNEVVRAFPNVTVIDVTQTIRTLSELLGKLSTIVQFFTVFSLAAGLLIVVSSILATRFARIQEAVYFRILGAKSRFVMEVFALENAVLGLLSGLLGLGIAQIAAWIVCVRLFEIEYAPRPISSLLMVLAAAGLVMAVGGAATRPVLRKKPVVFLREQTAE